MKCSEAMTRNPACCLPGDTVDRAAQLMKSEDVGPVPVIDSQQTKRLIGIVTDRDLALKIVAEGRDAKSTQVELVMTRDLITCREDDDLQAALAAMGEHQVRRIPIVDGQNPSASSRRPTSPRAPAMTSRPAKWLSRSQNPAPPGK